MTTLERLPSALVAANICTKLDLRAHTRLSTTSRFFGALCAQPAASPVFVSVVGDWPPARALERRPWLRPTRLDVDASRSDKLAAFGVKPRRLPSHLFAAAQQLVWRSSLCIDTAALREAPHLVALSLPVMAAARWREIAAECGPRLLAFECADMYGTPLEVDSVRFEFPRLRSLALLQRSPLDADALLGLARSCPELRDLEARIWEQLDDRVVALEFAHLASLHLRLAGDPAEQERGLARVCRMRLPRLRRLTLHATVTGLQPLSTFTTLEVLDVGGCHTLHVVNHYASEDRAAAATTTTSMTTASHHGLPDPLPTLQSLRLPLRLAPHLHVPRSYAATLTELEVQYATGVVGNLDRCDELPRLYPHLTHLLLRDAGTSVDRVQTILEAFQRVSAACVLLTKRLTEASSGDDVRLRTLTTRGTGSACVYDMRRAAEYAQNLNPVAYCLLHWRDIETTPALRCVDKQLLDERVLLSERVFGEWRSSDLAL